MITVRNNKFKKEDFDYLLSVLESGKCKISLKGYDNTLSECRNCKAKKACDDIERVIAYINNITT